MKPRTLFVLAIAIAALAFIVFRSRQSDKKASATAIGTRVLQEKDINAITRIQVTSGTQQVFLATSGGNWVVETLWNYPAQFAEVARLLRGLDQLRVSEVIPIGGGTLDEFGLAENASNFPARIQLFTADGAMTDDLLIGQPRVSTAMPVGFSPPDSRYMRSGHNPVILAEPFVPDVPRRATDWIITRLANFSPNDVASMTATPPGGAPYTITHAADGDYNGADALIDRPINKEGAALWFRSFQTLSTRNIIDPATPAETLERGQGGHVVAHLTNGMVVTVEMGAQTAENLGRYGWLSFAYQEPSALESSDTNALAADHAARAAVREEAQQLQNQYGIWTFVFDYSQATKFLFPTAQLIAPDTPGAPAAPPPPQAEPRAKKARKK